MKCNSTRIVRLVLCLVSAALPFTSATAGGEDDARLFTPPALLEKTDPVYPFSLSSQAIYRGTLTVFLEIDVEGRISDWLPVRGSHEAFIRSVASVLPRWRFRPATEDGQPVPSAMQIEFRFSHNNVMLNFNSFESTAAFLRSMRPDSVDPGLNFMVSFPELDTLPEPVEVTRPVVFSDIPREHRTGEAVITFFIDQEGKVRMPALASLEGDMRLAIAAEQAVRQWRFTPPTVSGRPVCVRAAQRFVFLEDEPADHPPPPAS